MKISSALIFMLWIALPLRLGASGPELLSITFKPGQPSLTNDLSISVEDLDWLEHAVEQDSRLMLRVAQIKYQIIGRADQSECNESLCSSLALKRAVLFQEALIRAGVPQSLFCTPLAKGAPWPSDYRPKLEELIFARQAIVEPMFHGCAPNNAFKPNLLRSTKHMAEKACHVFGSATQVGLI